MKRQKGFSLLELMVSMAIVVTVVGAAIGALVQAQRATEAVAFEANDQENVRAGMHFMVRDIAQAGEGIPQGGIAVPNSGAAGISAIIRPGMSAGVIFPNAAPIPPNFAGGFPSLTALVAGSQIGQVGKGVNPVTNAVLPGNPTDVINVVYADDVLRDAAVPTPHHLYDFPIYQPTPPAQTCNAGAASSSAVIDPNGAFVILDPACFLMPGAANPITVGNLIMFQNQNGTALEYVTSVAGQKISFAGGDPAGLNATGQPAGTVTQLGPGGVFPPTTITRVWMVAYYLDSTTSPSHPQLIRQVNYPNYPAGAPVNPPTAIADNIELLSFSYDITASNDPLGTYPVGPGNAPSPVSPDTANQIRAVNIFLAGRSDQAYSPVASPQFLRNNLSTQVSVRSLSFTNTFGTAASATAPPP
ncbi:MAG: prepilin-type N-terminal cleavage/methylation domain-containing protein [Candidatus Acidiferrales bacterium]